jgi:RNA polymerase sigma-70 factor (ECF subfamily)
VLLEIYFRGQSVAEAAEKLGIPPGTVKSRSHYALKTLRELYANTVNTANIAHTKKPAALREVAA